jgi:hypothetical protein
MKCSATEPHHPLIEECVRLRMQKKRIEAEKEFLLGSRKSLPMDREREGSTDLVYLKDRDGEGTRLIGGPR